MSFGSAVKPSQMTKERRAIFLEVFSQLGEQLVVAVYDCTTIYNIFAISTHIIRFIRNRVQNNLENR